MSPRTKLPEPSTTKYVTAPARVSLPNSFETVTSRGPAGAPAGSGGAKPVIVAASISCWPVRGSPPRDTTVLAVKLAPVTRTRVPPPPETTLGLTAVSFGPEGATSATPGRVTSEGSPGAGSPGVQAPVGSPSSCPFERPSPSESSAASTGPQNRGAQLEVGPVIASTSSPKGFLAPPVGRVWQVRQLYLSPLGVRSTLQVRASARRPVRNTSPRINAREGARWLLVVQRRHRGATATSGRGNPGDMRSTSVHARAPPPRESGTHPPAANSVSCDVPTARTEAGGSSRSSPGGRAPQTGANSPGSKCHTPGPTGSARSRKSLQRCGPGSSDPRIRLFHLCKVAASREVCLHRDRRERAHCAPPATGARAGRVQGAMRQLSSTRGMVPQLANRVISPGRIARDGRRVLRGASGSYTLKTSAITTIRETTCQLPGRFCC